MSLNHFCNQSDSNTFFNTRLNSLVLNNGLNMSNSGLVNVSTINGNPVPSGADLNSVNVIYKPGVPANIASNIYNNWPAVVAKANQTNVNQCLNIFFDDSVVSPVPITQTLDCKGRVNLYGKNLNSSSITVALINDGVQLKNPRSIGYLLQLNCQNILQSCIHFDPQNSCLLGSACIIKNTVDSLLPSIQITDNTNNYFVLDINAGFDNSLTPTIGAIHVGANAGLYFICKTGIAIDFHGAISGGLTSTLLIGDDGTVQENNFTQPLFTGTIINLLLCQAQNVNYDDTKVAPPLGSSNVQGAIDALKVLAPSKPPMFVASAGLPKTVAPGASVLFDQWNFIAEQYNINYLSGVITFLKAGIYIINYSMSANIAGAQISCFLSYNGVTLPAYRGYSASSSGGLAVPSANGSHSNQFAIGDTISLYVTNNSGVSLNIGTSINSGQANISVIYIGTI
jgi:hypothetical protein